jgi:Nuclease-related domain./Topoisomerase DNA binding C4 zinc finger.
MYTFFYWFFTIALGGLLGIFLVSCTDTYLFKGWVGELRVRFMFWLTLNKKEYVRFNGLIFELDGRTTEIDHVIISRFGIFVIETKNFDGVISGNHKAPLWSKRKGKEEIKFKNPIHQNYKHVCFVRDILNIDENKIKSVVVFASNFCEFKYPIAENVLYVSQAHKYIKSFVEPVFTKDEIKEFVLKIKNTKRCSRKKHIENMQQISKTVDPKCPKCCSEMKRRRNKKTGEYFWGCTKYPGCKGTRKN